MTSSVIITKANGEQEPFKREKLEESLKRSGADAETISTVADAIVEQLTPGMTTREIYRRAFRMLQKGATRATAARYSLRRSLLAFGPSGHPFEALVGELFAADGYDTRIRVMCDGACISHEIDVCACKNDECIGMEVKFHNAMGTKSDVQDALYVDARFRDVINGDAETKHGRITRGMLVTNTKFSAHAITYAECVGLALVGWGYPRDGANLEQRIESTGLHPVTCIPSLSNSVKQRMLRDDIVLCRSLTDTAVLDRYGLSEAQKQAVQTDVSELCT